MVAVSELQIEKNVTIMPYALTRRRKLKLQIRNFQRKISWPKCQRTLFSRAGICTC